MAELLQKTIGTQPPAGTHWSCRSFALEHGISKSTVQRLWESFQLAPHRHKIFKLSTDPYFVEKVIDVTGLYLSPPNKAVDEKSQCQALERTQPYLPLGLPKRRATPMITPAASDLMLSLQFGSRHYLHNGTCELPRLLAKSLRATFSGQIKLTETCTARFDRLASGSSWLPLIAIEFFVESRRTPPISRLTPVERHVYELLQTGASNREIAFQRGTSFATAKNQVSAVLSKLGVSRRHHLIIKGAGLISPPDQLNRPGMNGVMISTR